MTSLTEKIVLLHEALDMRSVPHAFGGALALAWCTQRARGTIDIDINIFFTAERLDEALGALPSAITWDDQAYAALQSAGQARLWWDHTPVDVFLNTTPFHDVLALRSHDENFAGTSVPFLSCTDLAVFKVFFNRTRDWADVEEMLLANSLDGTRVLGTLAQYLGDDDPRISRIKELLATSI